MRTKNSIKREIIKVYSISLLGPILIAVIYTIMAFKSYFDTNAVLERDKYLQFTTAAINNLYTETLDLSKVADYSSNFIYFKTNTNIYDENMAIINKNEVIKETTKNKKNFTSKIFPIIHNNDIKGYVEYKFIPSLYDNENSMTSSKNIIQSVIKITIISATVSILIAVVFLLIFIRSITKPILMLSDATEEIINKKYDDLELPSTKIYELNKLSNNISYLNTNLKMQDQIRKTYSQDINHELRTPLTNLQLTLEAMADGVIDMNEENITNSLYDINRLKVLIDNLKDTFNDEFNNLKLNNSTFSLRDELKNIAESFLPQYISKNVNLILETPYNQYVTLDKSKLNQIVNNLLSNALKASSFGDTVFLGFRKNNKTIELYVKDNGIGISEENLPLIFVRFFRVDNVRNTKENGYGLGLSIVKNLIEIMDLEIAVESILGKGTEFTILIPSNKYKKIKPQII